MKQITKIWTIVACACALGCQAPQTKVVSAAALVSASGGIDVQVRPARSVQALSGRVAKVTFAIWGDSLSTKSIDVSSSQFLGGSAVVEWRNLLPGTVDVKAQLFDAQSRQLGSATASALIQAEKVATLNLDVVPDVGIARFEVVPGALDIYQASVSLTLDPLGPGWQLGPPMPSPRAAASAVWLGGRVYAVGGDASDQIDRLDTESWKWTSVILSYDANIKRPIATATRVRNKILLMGRVGGRRDEYAAPIFLDPEGIDASARLAGGPIGTLVASVSSAPLADLRTNRVAIALASDGETVFAAGGTSRREGSGTTYVFLNLPYLEVFHAGKQMWTELAAMPTARGAAGAALLDGKVYVAGGFRWVGTAAADPDGTDGQGVSHASASIEALGAFEVYDPLVDRWATRSALPTPRYGHSLVESGKRLYAIGGADSSSAPLSTVESYDPATDKWRKEPSLVESRALLGGTPLPDGRIIVMGGMGSTGRSLRSVEVFRPGTTK